MARKVHAEELRERQNMRDAARTRKNGEWCIVGISDEWDPKIGLQGWGYESKADAQEVAREIDQEEEYQHVEDHLVMKHDEFEEMCEERGVDRNFPWSR